MDAKEEPLNACENNLRIKYKCSILFYIYKIINPLSIIRKQIVAMA